MKKKSGMIQILSLFLTVLLVFTLVTCKGGSSDADSDSQVITRAETLYVGGGLWEAPFTWNPFQSWSATCGTQGLVYEHLFNWDPLTDELVPWLAESGKWESESVYAVKVREGITWSDGKPLTADDVKFSFDIGKDMEELEVHSVWRTLREVEKVDEYTLKFHFENPGYQEWAIGLYVRMIVPKHIWEGKSEKDILEGENNPPVGSGPYLYETHDQDKMVWKKNNNWWAIKKMGMDPAPKRIVVLKIYSNSVSLGMVLRGDLDVSNFYLPGIPKLKNDYPDTMETWYDEAPYNAPDNVVWMFMNTKKGPLKDAAFRRAVAYTLDKQTIVEKAYENGTLPAKSVGYLPIKAWMQYYDEAIEKQHGFTYNVEQAKKMLKEAGYKDVDGDGYVEDPDGSKIELKVECPAGFTDWEASIKIMTKGMQAAGINAVPNFVDYGLWEENLMGEPDEQGIPKYDMSLCNWESNMQASVWYMYHWLTQVEGIEGSRWDGNYAAFDNEKARELVLQLNRTGMDKTEEARPIVQEIQKILLAEMPAVPVWINGLWFQGSTANWKNWPGDESPYALPNTNIGAWHLGTIKVLTQIEPVTAE